ncbi:MAG: GspH/FimT family pseudopilin [Planctomycetota bacterium]
MRGFTLVEVMILIVVGMIIAGVAMPAANTFDDMGISADVRILQADLEFAQARAIATGQGHRVLFDLDDNTYQVESPPGVVLDEPLRKRPWIRDLNRLPHNGSVLTSCDFGGQRAVLFDGAGTPASGGQVTFELGSFSAKLNVAPVTGVVSTVLP